MAQTGQWLLNHWQYTNWHLGPASLNFWLCGFMGSGKSCLSHAVIDDLKGKVDSKLG